MSRPMSLRMLLWLVLLRVALLLTGIALVYLAAVSSQPGALIAACLGALMLLGWVYVTIWVWRALKMARRQRTGSDQGAENSVTRAALLGFRVAMAIGFVVLIFLSVVGPANLRGVWILTAGGLLVSYVIADVRMRRLLRPPVRPGLSDRDEA